MMKSPCVNCERKGCGSYHDQCEPYQAFKDERTNYRTDKLKSHEISDFKFDRVTKARRIFHKK